MSLNKGHRNEFMAEGCGEKTQWQKSKIFIKDLFVLYYNRLKLQVQNIAYKLQVSE